MNSTPLICPPLSRLGLALLASVTFIPGACAGLPFSGNSVAASATGFVHSANEGEDSISRIDLAISGVMTLPLPVTPHNVQISHVVGRLFVVGSMAGQMKMVAPTAAPGDATNAAAKEPGRLLIFDATPRMPHRPCPSRSAVPLRMLSSLRVENEPMSAMLKTTLCP